MSPFKESSELAADPALRRPWIQRARQSLLRPDGTIDGLRDRLIPLWHRALEWLAAHRPYALIVILPTVITAAYFVLIAAPQYLSEAHFMVLGSSTQSKGGESAISQMMSTGPSDTNTLAVLDYLESTDAVDSLNKQLGLEQIYHRPKIDFVARVGSSPTIEELRKYLFRYGGMVHVSYDFMNFVGVLRVYAFDPQDAAKVADGLLKLGDELVDRLNKRSLDDALRVARGEVQRAEDRIATVGQKITNFRQHKNELDYSKSAETILGVIGRLESDRAQAQADVDAARAYMKPDSARFVELSNKVKALDEQIASQKSRLTGSDGALAPEMDAYEKLLLERTFANQDYERAAKALEDAYLQAQRQHLFLVRTVEVKAAERSEYPRGLLVVVTMFVTLTVAYGIGWLILAGVREHAG